MRLSTNRLEFIFLMKASAFFAAEDELKQMDDFWTQSLVFEV
jgi:hypothetical protein